MRTGPGARTALSKCALGALVAAVTPMRELVERCDRTGPRRPRSRSGQLSDSSRSTTEVVAAKPDVIVMEDAGDVVVVKEADEIVLVAAVVEIVLEEPELVVPEEYLSDVVLGVLGDMALAGDAA